MGSFFQYYVEGRPELHTIADDRTVSVPKLLGELKLAGRSYYDFRAALIVRNNEGLTKTYNRFHDPGEMSYDIVELRRLHEAMDRVGTRCLRLDESPTDLRVLSRSSMRRRTMRSTTRKKKRFRYRWPDEIRDDVLARLLVLNQQRYEEEVLAGLHDKADGSRSTRAPKIG